MKKLILSTLIILLTYHANAQNSNSLSVQLDELIERYHTVYGFTGTVKVTVHGDSIFEKSYGLADRNFEIKNTPETRNSINSISKTFTAAAILKLAEEGKINLQSAISSYLPELQAPWKNSITVHHLLTHSSGLPRESRVQSHHEKSLKEQALLVENLDLLFAPGKQYGYSNAGFILLGAILENVSGREYADFIESRIVKPIGLKNTGVYRGKNVVENQAVPYRFTSNGLEFAQQTLWRKCWWWSLFNRI